MLFNQIPQFFSPCAKSDPLETVVYGPDRALVDAVVGNIRFTAFTYRLIDDTQIPRRFVWSGVPFALLGVQSRLRETLLRI